MDVFKTDLEMLLLEVHSRERTDAIAAMIGGDADRFAVAWDIFCNGTPPLPQRMAWVLDVVTTAHPSLAARYVDSIAARLPYLQHPAEARAALKILARTQLPRETIGQMLPTLFEWLENHAKPIVVRVFSMQLLYQISNIEPELKRELALIIDLLMQEGGPAICARGRHLLPRLNSEIKAMEIEAQKSES